jgi:hypothetical protein
LFTERRVDTLQHVEQRIKGILPVPPHAHAGYALLHCSIGFQPVFDISWS